MDPAQPRASAILVDGDWIIAVGVFEDLDSGQYEVDDTFADAVVCAGFIDQHLHPVLGAATLVTEVIATEDWALPGKLCPAAQSQDDYRQRLAEAEQRTPAGEWLISWGYHRLWHGVLDRGVLDQISASRPIAVWRRSCHEWFLNSAAIDTLGITAASMAGHGAANTMVDVAAGLRQMVDYLHHNGVTAFNEPGSMWDLEPWLAEDLYDVDPARLNEVTVLGSVYAGRWFPAGGQPISRT